MPTTEIYTLSLHDALPIWNQGAAAGNRRPRHGGRDRAGGRRGRRLEDRRPRTGQSAQQEERPDGRDARRRHRSEEHTSELQSLRHLVCRLLLEKKKKKKGKTPGEEKTTKHTHRHIRQGQRRTPRHRRQDPLARTKASEHKMESNRASTTPRQLQ